MKQQQQLTPADVDRVVAELDRTRRAEHFRDHDGRPDPRIFKPLRRVPIEVVRAQTRIRTAHWRNQMDRRKAPTASQIGMALVWALINARLPEMTWTDKDLLARALMDLQARGFSVVQAKATLRRLRNRHVHLGDRDGEPTASTGLPLGFDGKPVDDLPF
ncbi:hypothetical protein IVB38_12640 [Bradyrhizobium sp. 38]|uniref:hypothetical protein n=1 Tax=unclassified Bradyrhizobium TaxID=2631580 RepID=UPI001FF9CDFE|nr:MULTISPECIES: hypothetical protein [unclassified Bradyrhizobium]MCK1336846.1 hypothetical protein [Bradyrhizobium sp. 38]MCK1776866.1 hypothetical protein [Bradyrhizobium sp. 132]